MNDQNLANLDSDKRTNNMMGNSNVNSGATGNPAKTSETPSTCKPITQATKGPGRRFLCLHGWRTSGQILTFQTAAMRANIGIDAHFIDGPFPATGPPDEGIQAFYQGFQYFQWCQGLPDGSPDLPNIEISVQMIVEYIQQNGPFDGILGFSQGAAMATRVLSLMEEKQRLGEPLFPLPIKCAILIGGVRPKELHEAGVTLSVPSLHIHGLADPYLPSSRKLEEIYDAATRVTLTHEESHNVPSMKTKLYPTIKQWVATVLP